MAKNRYSVREIVKKAQAQMFSLQIHTSLLPDYVYFALGRYDSLLTDTILNVETEVDGAILVWTEKPYTVQMLLEFGGGDTEDALWSFFRYLLIGARVNKSGESLTEGVGRHE